MFCDIMLAAVSNRFLLIGPFGWSELIIVLVLILIFFGPKRLPDVAEAIGKSLRKFKKASKDIKDEVESSTEEITEDEEKRG
ncbi:MAG: twin-arginine translocase TatA/TatE family subunit [Candidatus Krumholzibacteriota bacterium]|nr:twin-arginine translocase TatA/TatE family subunit [Candidatus Krumholzibacteriota bacterium]